VKWLNQSFKSWNIEILSIKAVGYAAIHATAPGVSTWPSWLCDQPRYLEILTFNFLRGGSIISDSCSSIWRLVKYDNLTPRKFVASTCPKRKPTWPCFIRFSPPGSDQGSCVGSKLGYMKAPKNMTLEKYLNISFPAPIRKQKKSTWSVCLFLCLYDRSVCKCLIATQRHLKVESPFAGHFSIFFLCGWCALCTSHWWTPVHFFQQWLNFVVWFTTCSFDNVRMTSILDTWMLFIFVGCVLLLDFF